MLTFGNHINKAKGGIAGIMKSMIGDGYFFTDKPTIKDDNTLVWKDFFGKESAVYDGTFLNLDGGDNSIQLPSTTFKSYAAMYKPATTTQPLMEVLSEQGSEISGDVNFSGNGFWLTDAGAQITGGQLILNNGSYIVERNNREIVGGKTYKITVDADSIDTAIRVYIGGQSSGYASFTNSGVETYKDIAITTRQARFVVWANDNAVINSISIKEIPTLSLSSGTPTTTGIATPTTFKQDKGDWSLIGFSNPDDIIGAVNVGKVGTDYMAGGVYNIYQFPKELTEADRTWLLANPNANKTETFAELGISSGSCYTCGEGAGDYVVDVWAELGTNVILNSTLDNSDNIWLGSQWAISSNKLIGTANGTDSDVIFYTTVGDTEVGWLYFLKFDVIASTLANGNIFRLRGAGGARLPDNQTYDYGDGQLQDVGEKIITIVTGADSDNGRIIFGLISLALSGTIEIDNIYCYRFQAATINGATWQTAQTTGRHGAIETRTTPEINGETICLPSPDGVNDYFGNAIDGSLLYDGRGLNLSKYDYATYDAITVARAGGAIVLDFVVRNWVDGNAGGYHALLGNSITTYGGVFLDSDDIKVESDTNADSWADVASAVSMESRLKLVLNANATVLTKTKTDDGALTQIDSRTPSDDITLSNISNSNATVRINGWIKNITIADQTLTDANVDLLIEYISRLTYWDTPMSARWDTPMTALWDVPMDKEI